MRRLVRRWDPQSTSSTNLGSRSVPTARSSRRTREVGETGAPIRKILSGKTAAALDESIKTAALEALAPSELEQHLAMNRARLITHEQVRSEIQAAEIRSHSRQLLQGTPQIQWMWTTILAKGQRERRQERQERER